MKEEKICRNCENVKILDADTGRCMKVDGLFCKLDDKTHVCDDYRKVKQTA